ncbi:MAG: hypothetical protein K2J13_03145, partial [Clostridia bacterium]|nr:hypothetical protein [Clostridia bacterium]
MDIKKKKLRMMSFSVSILLAMLIVLSCAISIITTKSDSNNVAQAVVSGSSDIGKLTVDGYESNPSGKIFDGDKLRALYSQLVGKDNATYSDVVNLLANSSTGALNSANFRTTSNGGNEIYVTLDNKKWVAMYLANNKSSQPVLTLWLVSSSDISNANYSSYPYNTYTASSLGDYPANMYATSKVRAVALNNGGDYGTSTTTYNTATKSAKHPFAKFTMENGTYDDGQVTGSFYNFIETPKQMEWQEFESTTQGHDPDGFNYENDAWNKVGGFVGLKRDSLETITGYGSWNEDKIWLPSIVEIGYENTPKYRGLWQESDVVFKSSADYWTRSAAGYNYYDTNFSQAGVNVRVNLSRNIRPAFHLNLYEIEKSTTTAKPVQGSKVKDYENNNANIDFELLGVDSSKLDIECSGIDVNGDPLPKNTMTYNPIDGGGVVRLTASKVGVYTVKVTPKSGVCWPDKSTNAIEFTYYIKYKVAELGISGSNTAVYNGKEQSFALLNYDKDKMDVKADSVADLTFDDDGTPAVFKVTKAKTYNVNVELKNTTLMEWSSGGTGVKSVSVEITKKKVTKPTLSDNPPSKPYTGSPVNFPLSNYTAGGDVVLKDPSSATVSAITQTNAGTYVYT